MAVESTFNEMFTLSRASVAADGHGGFGMGTFASYGSYRGRMSSLGKGFRQGEQAIGAQELAMMSHVFFCGIGTPIRRDDRITDVRGHSYRALLVRVPSARTHIEVDCRELQEGEGEWQS